jgi:RNA polymerase subunit RPABC4/transcription elongation factor Spt4
MMFFFIGGIQPRTKIVDKQARLCPACRQIKVYRKRIDHYLSLFFIPLFPVKKGAPFLICENCHAVIDERGTGMDVRPRTWERRCPRCERVVDPDFSFCPYCGQNL